MKKIILTILFCLFCFNLYAGSFGNSDTPTSALKGAPIFGGVFQMANVSGQQADSLTAYIYVQTGGGYVKTAIYDNSTPRNLIAYTSEQAVSSSGWVTFNFSSPPSLTASANYFLCIFVSDTSKLGIGFTQTESNFHYGTAAYGTFPSTLYTTAYPLTYRASIYCNYSSGSTPPPSDSYSGRGVGRGITRGVMR